MVDAKKIEGRLYPFHGYAPGNYMNFCFNCRQQFEGDKRAVRCEPCAEYMADEINKLDTAALCERLEREYEGPRTGQSKFLNPDGPEAAEALRSLSLRVEAEKRAREEAERWVDRSTTDRERDLQIMLDAEHARTEAAEAHSADLARALEEAKGERDELLHELAQVQRPADADDRPCDDTWEDANLLWDFADRARAILGASNA